MQKKSHIKKGDMVRVISGEERGKQGRVLEVKRERDTAIVEGLSIRKKHSKPTTANPQGGILDQEGPIHLSNLMLVDPKGGEATRVGRKKDKDGKLVRYSKRTGEVIKS